MNVHLDRIYSYVFIYTHIFVVYETGLQKYMQQQKNGDQSFGIIFLHVDMAFTFSASDINMPVNREFIMPAFKRED